MGLLFALMVGLVAATVAAALVTGQRLGERRKVAFQLQMAAEEMRRRAAESEDRKKKTEGHLAILRRVREEKRQALQALCEELKGMQEEEGRQIGVSLGLRRRVAELEAVAA